jgi:RHS repeat-associated protein
MKRLGISARIIALTLITLAVVGTSPASANLVMENPGGLIATARPAFVDLSWEAVSFEELVKHYAVYVNDTDFITVVGMTPYGVTTDTTMTISGLENNQTCYFAVVAVNLSDEMNEAITAVPGAPLPGTVVSGSITHDTTWTLDNSPYVVTGDITVHHTGLSYYTDTTPKQVTLTMAPGVAVHFEPGTGLVIGKPSASTSRGYFGALAVQGTADDPVVFTSNAAAPGPGDWKGIYFRNATDNAGSAMVHGIVEYGGSENDAAVYVDRASLPIRNCQINHSSTMGIRLTAASPTIDNCIIRNNASTGVSADDASGASIVANTIDDNGGYAVDVHPNRVHKVNDNTGSGNGYDCIRIRGGDIIASHTWKQQANGSLPYVVTGDITVHHTGLSYYTDTTPKQVTLTMAPGVAVRFEPGTGLVIGKPSASTSKGYFGALAVQGTADDPVVFTSNAAAPGPGDWKGIYFRNATDNAGSAMVHGIVEYGGSENDAAVYVDRASLPIRNCQINHSSTMGIRLTAASPTIDNCIIRNNASTGVSADDASGASIVANTIDDNGGYAVDVHPNRVHKVNDNTGSGNGYDCIRIRGGDIIASHTWKQQANGSLPYVVTGDITVHHTGLSYYTDTTPKQVTLTMAPGVAVHFEPGTGLVIGKPSASTSKGYFGALAVQGTADDPVVFTSNAAAPGPGDWKGIYFRNANDDAASAMVHGIVEYGGSENDAAVYVDRASLPIRNCQINHSSTMGIRLTAASPTIDNCIIRNNASTGVSADGASGASIVANTIDDNGGYAVDVHPNRVHKVNDNTGSGNGYDCIRIRGGDIIASHTWKQQANGSLPYVVTGDITVHHTGLSYYTDTTPKQVTLTMAPGVAVHFEPGTGLVIGKPSASTSRGYFGALAVQGTADDPVVFTSNAAAPGPGDWKGIYFRNATDDAGSLLEHCIVEYGGHTHDANLAITNARPTLQYNTLRNSSHSGLYVYENGSDGLVVNCNNFKDNLYGITTAYNAQPMISGNNFLGNRECGFYNAHDQIVTVNDNWWGDANGPNTNGDGICGPVSLSTWLPNESDCVSTPPTNSAPFVPRNPSPADNAVRIAVTEAGHPIDVTLSWSGGDPNPWDAVVYDLYVGQLCDDLAPIAHSLTQTTFDVSGLAPGTTYCWQVVSRDDVGSETIGPIWKLTTLGEPPDLVVTGLSWEPLGDWVAGQDVVLTATIANNGSGPVVEPFTISFCIDGQTIGTDSVPPVIDIGEALQTSIIWSATRGGHTLVVVADSNDTAAELDNTNNTRSETLPMVIDGMPPVLVNSVPQNGSVLQTLSTICFTLSDAHGTIDDAAVMASVTLNDSMGQTVSGSIAENGDVFTFTPDMRPLPDGTYSLVLSAVDDSGNTAAHAISLVLDGLAPSRPVITGGDILSGPLASRPAVNRSNSTAVTVTGSREKDTEIWIDGSLQVDLGGANWSTVVSLSQGTNTLEIWSQDSAGNRSESVFVDIETDAVAPRVTGTTPAVDSFLNTAPTSVSITYVEDGSGLNQAGSTYEIKDAYSAVVQGQWNLSIPGVIGFTPSVDLVDGQYTIGIQLEDNFFNRSKLLRQSFTVDTQAPAAPAVNPVTTPTHNPSQQLIGSKEAFAVIVMNGSEIVAHTDSTVWQHEVALSSGENRFEFTAIDRAGNTSAASTCTIIFDDIPPDPVTTLMANGRGTGTEATLQWSGYDEAAHGDVALYRIYWQEVSAFGDVAGMTPRDTVPAGKFAYTATGLKRGTRYWFAVIAVDAMGNYDSTVTAVMATTEDIQAPEDITGLAVQSFADRLVFAWSPPADAAGDLAGYRVYIDGSSDYLTLLPDRLSYEMNGLSAATFHTLRVTAVDNQVTPNESHGVSQNGVTWLPNPDTISSEPFSGYVRLNWNAVEPSTHLQHYRVYLGEAPFTDTTGMSPVIATDDASANVAGLSNGTPYWFAVTTVNRSNGENPLVDPVVETPIADKDGPQITNLTTDGNAVGPGFTLEVPVTLSLNAEDPSGVGQIQFFLDGNLIRTAYTVPCTCYLDPADMADGAHELTITAHDTVGNSRTLTVPFTVALALPRAPVIDQPATGYTTNNSRLVVSGRAETNAAIQLSANGGISGDWTAVDNQGRFSLTHTLFEGDNRIQAATRNRSGTGPLSQAVVVTLNTALPSAPSGVIAQAKSGGVVSLNWQTPAATPITGYNLYRSQTEFVTADQAVKVNVNPIVADRFDDLPASDGIWHYRVTAIDSAANESKPSVQVSAVADSLAPRAESIEYTPGGPFDLVSGTMAPGTIDITLTVSEPLQALPFLSMVPAGGVPISVDLFKVSDLTYAGAFVITDTTPSGDAWAIFSARDKAGNRGTEIDAGGIVRIDTIGPAVSRLEVTPAAPIQNDAHDPVTMTVTIGLDEPVKDGTLPSLAYLLSGKDRQITDVDALTLQPTHVKDAQTWSANFTLPHDAGLSEAASLELIYAASDRLNNLSTRIDPQHRFQVYQGELPPLAAPEGLQATAISGGRIRLSWKAVDGSAGYMIYRQGPDDNQLTWLARVETSLEIEDATEKDGVYVYAVTSMRSENGQASESGLSETVSVYADAVPPTAPDDLVLAMTANGIEARWQPPAYTEPVTYSLYRAPAAQITSVENLTPWVEGIEETTVVDPTPSQDDHCYTVTAVDEAGNESSPSPSFYLNFELLPASSIQVEQTDGEPPVISWTHPAISVAGFDVYLGDRQTGIKLNDTRLTHCAFTDIGWSGDSRRYSVVATDLEGVESLGRAIELPAVHSELAEGSVVRRGLMNRLVYTVANQSDDTVAGMRLHVEMDDRSYDSELFSLSAGQTDTIDVVVGGHETLIDPAELTSTIEIVPGINTKTRIVRNSQVAVGDGMLALQLHNEEFTRGGSGSAWFTLENTGDETIEVITARNSGASDSDQINFTLMDADDNVIAAQSFRQVVGEDMVTLSDGSTVARIRPGETFTATPVQIDIPSNAPDELVLQLVISDIFYHHGRESQVGMDGLSTTHRVTLTDTAYTGTVAAITPEVSSGDEEIIVSGYAAERSSGHLLANVPLKLVIVHDGFERNFEIYTQADGSFTHAYAPLSGESGIFQVRVVHPDLTDKPVHGQFTINRISAEPHTIALDIPKNYEQEIDFTVSAGAGTSVRHLRLEYDPEDQPGGVVAAGVHLNIGDPIALLAGGDSATIPVTIWADNAAAHIDTMVLRVTSAENDSWCKITIDAGFTEARPVLEFVPDHIETGMRINAVTTETIVITNNGFAAMTGIRLSLVSGDGSTAPSWANINGKTRLADLAVGDNREISLTFAPTDDIAEGVYHLVLRVHSDNYPQTDINLYVSVTQSDVGNALFKIADIYTGTRDEDLNLIQGLAGARVTLQNELVTTQEYTDSSDEAGEVVFPDIPAGRYKVRVTAADHREHVGRIWVKPGVTATQDVFLDYNVVTVDWSVSETTIQDNYEIVLSATYETEVPAAVVGIAPMSITLPEMQAGDVFNTEVTLTNHGLIRADDVAFSLPADDAHFVYETLANIPDTIAARQQITIPIRITCLSSLSMDADGSGGGCHPYVNCGRIDYYFCCANGNKSVSLTTYCVTHTPPGCSSSGTTGGTGGSWTVGVGRTGGSGASGYAPAATPIEAGPQCYPDIESRKECWCDPCSEMVTCQDVLEPVGSSVNTLMRNYTREDKDLTIKVPGGLLDLKRVYRDNQWIMAPFGVNSSRQTMGLHQYAYVFEYAGETYTVTTALIRDGIVYKRPPDSFAVEVERKPDGSLAREPRIVYFSNLFVDEDGNQMKAADGGGYVWESRSGKSIHYDQEGRVAKIGNRTGILALPIYDAANHGRLEGVADRHGNPVAWCEYDENQRVVAIRDCENMTRQDCRRVQYHYDDEGRLERATDVMGNDTHYTYADISRQIDADSKADIYYLTTSYKDPSGSIQENIVGGFNNWVAPQTTFDSALASIEDPQGRLARMIYNESGDIVAYEDDQGRKTFSYDYDKTQKEYYVSIGYPSGKIKEVWFDDAGNTRRVDINGRTVKRISKDMRAFMVADETNRITRYEYDEWNHLTAVIYPDGSQETTTYDLHLKKPVEKIDANGSITQYAYDQAGNLIRKVEAVETVDERTTEYAYDESGNLVTITKPGDDVTPSVQTVMAYDDKGNLTRLTDPGGGITRFASHDAMGNVLEKIDPLGNTWEYGYDAMGRLLTETDPLGTVTTHRYDAVGNRIASIDGEGRQTAYAFDSHNNLIRTMDHEGNEVSLEYNLDNKLIRQIDAEGKVTQYHYDNEGRMIQSIDGHGDVITLDYDDDSGNGCASCSGAAGSLPSRVVYPTFEKAFAYDTKGHKISETDVVDETADGTSGFAYDAAGNLISRTDKMGRTTYYTYDALNRLISVVDPASGATQYAYDNRDNLIALTDAENQTTHFEYDANDRLVKETRPMGAETHYRYDAAGNLIEKIDAQDQKTAYGYDSAGKLLQISYFASSGGNVPIKTITFTYDKEGNLTGYGDGTTSAVYAYNSQNQKTEEIIDYGGFTLVNQYTYYKNGALETYTGPDDVTNTYHYDDNNQLASVQIPDVGFVTIGGYTWTRPASMTLPGGSAKQFAYDPLMRVHGITVSDPADNPVLNYKYTYDHSDNIISKNTDHGDYNYVYDDLNRLTEVINSALPDEIFSYDAVGNRLASADTSSEWSYNTNNELDGYDDVTYDYDLNGNMIEKNVAGVITRFFYNVADRLERVEDGSGNIIASYYYDPFGRRLWKTVAGDKTCFHYNDAGLAGEYDDVGNVIKTYGFKPGSHWTTDPLFMKVGTDYYFYHNDHLGTPQKMTAVNGAVVWEAVYGAFGEAEIGVESVENNLRFPGQYFDAETGLHYNYFRYYDPEIGRYLRTDPIGLWGGINQTYYYSRSEWTKAC